MLTVTTVALAIEMAANLAALKEAIFGGRTSESKKQQFETFVTQQSRFSRECQSIAALLKQYNEILAEATRGASIAALAPLCTAAGYERARALPEAYRRAQMIHLALERLELLAVDIKETTVGQMSPIEKRTTMSHAATAYAREAWLAFYSNGGQLRTDVVNAYHLVWDGGCWKIRSNEVFSKQPAT